MSRRDRDLFERHSKVGHFAEMSATEVVTRCEKIIAALKPFAGTESFDTQYGQGAVPVSAIPALKIAVPLVEDLDRHMPYIMAWSVGYWWGRNDANRSTFFGCASKAQADRICAAANKADGRRKRKVGDTWTAEFMAVAYNDMVKRTFSAADAARVVEGL
jgi:hypothetical protein